MVADDPLSEVEGVIGLLSGRKGLCSPFGDEEDVRDPLGDSEGVRDPLGESEGVRDPLREDEGVPDSLGEDEGVCDPWCDGEGVRDPFRESVRDPFREGEGVRDPFREGEGASEEQGNARPLGLRRGVAGALRARSGCSLPTSGGTWSLNWLGRGGRGKELAAARWLGEVGALRAEGRRISPGER